MFRDQAARIWADAAGIPTDRARSREAFNHLNTARDFRTLRRLIHIVIINPTPGMGRNLMTRIGEGARDGRVQFQSATHTIDGQWQLARGEGAQDAPHTGPRAVIELAFHGTIALTKYGRTTRHFMQISFSTVFSPPSS